MAINGSFNMRMFFEEQLRKYAYYLSGEERDIINENFSTLTGYFSATALISHNHVRYFLDIFYPHSHDRQKLEAFLIENNLHSKEHMGVSPLNSMKIDDIKKIVPNNILLITVVKIWKGYL